MTGRSVGRPAGRLVGVVRQGGRFRKHQIHCINGTQRSIISFLSVWYSPSVPFFSAVGLESRSPRHFAMALPVRRLQYGTCWGQGPSCFHVGKTKALDCDKCGQFADPGSKKPTDSRGGVQYLCAACFWEAIPLDKRCPCVDNAAMAAKHDESRRSKIGTQLHPSALVASSSAAASSSVDRMEGTADAVMRTPSHALDSKMLLQLVHGQQKVTQGLQELKKRLVAVEALLQRSSPTIYEC